MQIDTESQMVASILAKKKTAGATHALIDIPLGPSAKIRSLEEAEHLRGLFGRVARAIDLDVDVITTDDTQFSPDRIEVFADESLARRAALERSTLREGGTPCSTTRSNR